MYQALSWEGPGFEATKVHACDIKINSQFVGHIGRQIRAFKSCAQDILFCKSEDPRGVPDSESQVRGNVLA